MAKIVIVLVVVVVGVIGGGIGWWLVSSRPAQPGMTSQTSFVVAKNQPAGKTVDRLARAGLIRSAGVAKLYLFVTGLDRQLQSGTFLLAPNQSLVEILAALTRSPQDVWVVIPEGWRREQIARRLDAALAGEEKAFVAKQFVALTATMEGKLFPDTYLVPRYATAEDTVAMLLNNYTAKVGELDQQSLILASLVERETRTDVDRRIVAGIMAKRLEAGWPLQVDATVQYARDSLKCAQIGPECDWWAPLADSRFPSAYNTYLHPGLPPAPIANPGLASIQAVLAPQSTDYWFWLHTPDGQTFFARDFEEHNLNVDKYLKP